MDSDLDSFLKTVTYKGRDKVDRRNPPEKSEQHPKELNPYWNDGGSGLPFSMETKKLKTQTGDGGLSWWTKALQRCKETAKEEGKTLDEIASERYGSLEFIENKIKDAQQHLDSTIGSSSSSTNRRDGRRWKNLSFKKPDHSRDMGHHSDDRRFQERNEMTRNKDGRDRNVASKRDTENSQSRKVVSSEERNEFERTNEMKDVNKYKSEVPTQSRKTLCKDLMPQRPSEQTMPTVISAEEKNKLSAKLLRAEMMGDKDMVKKLKAMLEGQSQCDPMGAEGRERKRRSSDDEEELSGHVEPRGVPGTSSSGRLPSDVSEMKYKKHKVESSKDDRKTKHFQDYDDQSLASLVKSEKLSTGLRDGSIIRKLGGKAGRMLDEDEIIDDRLSGTVDKPAGTFSKEKHLAIIEQKIMSSKIDGCPFCLKNLQKHLIVSMGTKVLLCLPRQRSMVAGHCLVVPIQHVVQSTVCDEDVLEEINLFKKCLVRMFQENDEDVVFMETCKNLKNFPHLVIECIPLPREAGDEAPMYFQKAISECGPEWSNNKKLVTIKKGIKRSIPPGFPYFHVGFGMDDGYGHVIEDELSFPPYFGREVVGGMLDVEPTMWRRPKFDEFDDQRKKVLEFSKAWKAFDPTTCDGGE